MKKDTYHTHLNKEQSCFSEYRQKAHNSESMIFNYSSKNIAQKLSKLPTIKAKPNFEKKMAALFALELENEIHTRNSEWLNHKKSIKLPELIDLQKEFL